MVASRLTAILAIASFPLLAAAEPELVLRDDVRLTASNASGAVSVVAGKGLERTFEWNGCSFVSPMVPRGSRWFGSLGIQGGAPGAGVMSSMLPQLFTCKGFDRTGVEEAQLHLPDRAAAERWIARYAKNFDTVWSNDGLVVQWIVSPERRKLNVWVWQLCISGRKPTELAGASDASIRFTQAAGEKAVRHDCTQVDRQVMSETQRIWQEHWRQSDQWDATLARRAAERARSASSPSGTAPNPTPPPVQAP
jgi:hypothetical protein